jgi:hypothetical protein
MLRPPFDSLVPVKAESELKPGLTVWAFDDSPGFEPRWYGLVLIRPVVTPLCRGCGPHCPGWEVLNAPTGAKGLCHRQCIAQGRLWRDEEPSQEQSTERRREREAVR